MPEKMKTAVFLKQKKRRRAATTISISSADTPTKKVQARKGSLRMVSKSVKLPEQVYLSWLLSG